MFHLKRLESVRRRCDSTVAFFDHAAGPFPTAFYYCCLMEKLVEERRVVMTKKIRFSLAFASTEI